MREPIASVRWIPEGEVPMSDARKHPTHAVANVNHQYKNMMGWRVLTGGFFDLEKFWMRGQDLQDVQYFLSNLRPSVPTPRQGQEGEAI